MRHFKEGLFLVVCLLVGIGVSRLFVQHNTQVTVEENSSASVVETVGGMTSDIEEPETKGQASLTISQKNALRKAEEYLEFSAFSYQELIDQLVYNKFSQEDATYAADHCGADWRDQAVKKAKQYIDFSAFSYQGLIDQLVYEKFPDEDAAYAAEHCGADWMAQAVKKAKQYLEYTGFSRDGLIDQLEYDGFTHEQAVYAVDQAGL